jgi:Putative Actinobacterial Holin-X, holin superfamily III
VSRRDRTSAVTATHEETRLDEPPTIAGAVDLVKEYAKQETIGPIKGAGRWIGMGMAGAFTLGLGLALVLLGLLRLLQTEWARSARGALSWLSYLIVLVVCLGLIALAVSRINKDSLHKEPK